MNPVLPRRICLADPEARVLADGRLFLYGSLDRPGRRDYCSNRYRAFSTSDLRSWVDHGESFRSPGPPFDSAPLYAPDCVEYGGRHHLFFCQGTGGGREGMAWSERPEGPFLDPVPVAGADGLGIDPAVLVDDDGEVYLFWGQRELFGARLTSGLRAIVPGSLQTRVLTYAEHGFCEGASIRKIRGRYCLLYADLSRGRATCLSYAWSDRPLGPYRREGVVLDNGGADLLSWNNHGSLAEFGGRWYLFYHRSSRGSRFSRRVCVEPVDIQEDGAIPEVGMSTQGAGPPLPARDRLEAWRSCFLYGRVATREADGTEHLAFRAEGAQAHFRDLAFEGEKEVRATIRGRGQLFLNLGDPMAATQALLQARGGREWQTVAVRLRQPPEGTQGVFVYAKEAPIDLRDLQFS